MRATNMREITKENRKQNHRKIAVPKRNAQHNLKNPFYKQFVNGNFKNNIYSNYSPLFIAWVYIRTLILFLIPAFILHSPLLLIKFVNVMVTGENLIIAGEGTLLAAIYGIPLFFAFRRISDHMAYYRVNALVGKHDLNQLVLASLDRVSEDNKELTVMNHTRMKFSKVSLFPTVKEFAVEHQLYEKEIDNKNGSVRTFAQSRRHAMSTNNKSMEHHAAKAIADRKQSQHGGSNEYDEMVRRYKNRTTPMIRDIIKQVQGNF